MECTSNLQKFCAADDPSSYEEASTVNDLDGLEDRQRECENGKRVVS